LFVTHTHEIPEIILRAIERSEAEKPAEEGEMKGHQTEHELPVIIGVAILVEEDAVCGVGREDREEVEDEIAA
jgi:hypothetical protein